MLAPETTPATSPPATAAVRLRIRGRVQGVGFRPFVCRTARALGLTGRVGNDTAGVFITAEGSPEMLAALERSLRTEAPPSARVESVQCTPIEPPGLADFAIEPSEPGGLASVRVPPDLACCEACRREVFDPADRRSGYPFTNCTHCGPRYSILRSLPYDRPRTSMARFPLCPACEAEYRDPADRRFHAQPTACTACGPTAWYSDAQGQRLGTDSGAIEAAARALLAGQIVAVKGLGGYQLLGRADRSEVVQSLRTRKHRPSKPLAVMVPSLCWAERLARLSAAEIELLTAPTNPIVLVERHPEPLPAGPDDLWPEFRLAPEVAPRLNHIGLLLPTTPLHHLLLSAVSLPLIATSGNRGDEPIVTEEAEALTALAGLADGFLSHDRPIVRRVDDSVARVIAGRPVLIRLARGFAPLPLPALERLAQSASPPIPPVLAVAGQQKVAPALWSGAQAVLGPHLGDLDGPAGREAFDALTHDLVSLYQADPARLAEDAHPDYTTTHWAEAHALPRLAVQHHHAHAAAAMVEYGLIDRAVLALSFDGTGFGTDGTLWGGEILRATLTDFERLAALRPLALPGGEAAIRQPRRVALAALADALGAEIVLADAALLARLGLSPSEARVLLTMVQRRLNTVWSSGAGRLFDAVAALLLGPEAGVVSHEGEAATWLEAVADPAPTAGILIPTSVPTTGDLPAGDRAVPRGDWRPMLQSLVSDLAQGVPVPILAARFHDALAGWAASVAAAVPELPDVVLGGGCFVNRRLTEATLSVLAAVGKRAHAPGLIPPGDGGLAAGQLAVALARLHDGPEGRPER